MQMQMLWNVILSFLILLIEGLTMHSIEEYLYLK